MSWQAALTLGALGYSGICALLCVRRQKRNRRIGLPAPRPDSRNSIEQFRRIHQS
jgi:hypothetical protein